MTWGNEQGEPIILLHGSSTNSAMWMGDAMELGKHLKVFAIDLIGEAGKSSESRPELEGATYCHWLCQVMDSLDIKNANVLGNSLGGWMGLGLAVHAPHRVKRLILLAASGIAPAKLSFVFKAMLFLAMGDKGITRLNKVVYGNQEIPEEAIEYGSLMIKHFKPRMDSLYVYSEKELKGLSMPILYIGGKEDALLQTQKSAERLEGLATTVKTVVLENTGHVLTGMSDQIITFVNQKKA